jgi:hypothetical protein
MANAITMIDANTATALKDALKAEGATKTKWTKATDLLIAQGITSKLLETRKDGENDKLRTQVKALIVTTFDAAKQAVLLKETKSLDTEGKKFKRETTQEIGRYMSLIEGKLKKAEAEANPKTKEELEAEAAESTKTEMQKIQALLDDVLKKVQKLEAPSFDVAQVVKNVKAIKGSMPSV